MAAKGVLDLTFMEIKDETEFIKRLEDFQGNKSKGNSSPTKQKQEDIKALRLSNNSIPNFLIFSAIESSLLTSNKIMWIDLSFNQLKRIDEGLASHLPNLQTLYLHANKIPRYSDIRRLSCFTHIKSLTLYGNPVEEQKHYRNVVLYYFPNLTQLDFSVITSGERDMVSSWAQIFRNCLSPDMQTLTF